MNETSRGLVLLASLLLWMPVLPSLLAGQMTTAQAGLRYAGALLLAWGGGSALAALFRAYASDAEVASAGDVETDDGRPARGGPDAAGRRQEDLTGG